MLIQELQESIIKNNIKNKLIFTGEESYLQNLYVKQIAKKTYSKLIFADNFLSIKKSLLTNTVLDKNKVFVIRNSPEFVKEETLFDDIIPAKDKYLILIFDKIDKRSSFYKNHESELCVFEKLTETQLNKVIKKYDELKNLNEQNCSTIINLVNRDYGRLLLELDKLIILSKVKNINVDESFSFGFKDGLFYQELEDALFPLVDVILNKDNINTYILLKTAKYNEFDVFSLMGLLYNNYKNMLLISCNNDVNISEYIKSKLRKYIRKYSIDELIDKMKIIQEIEQGIKTGKVEADIADEILLIRLLNY